MANTVRIHIAHNSADENTAAAKVTRSFSDPNIDDGHTSFRTTHLFPGDEVEYTIFDGVKIEVEALS